MQPLGNLVPQQVERWGAWVHLRQLHPRRCHRSVAARAADSVPGPADWRRAVQRAAATQRPLHLASSGAAGTRLAAGTDCPRRPPGPDSRQHSLALEPAEAGPERLAGQMS